jgi:hypothetical protein
LPHIGFAKLGSSAKNADNGWERLNSFRNTGEQHNDVLSAYRELLNHRNMRTVAKVGMNGSIDRNCYPQFYRRTKKLMQEREDLPSQLIRTLAATQRREVPSPVRALNELRKYCTQ